MEDGVEGCSVEILAVGEEEFAESPRQMSTARKVGRRRTKFPKSLSPRLRLADMKRGGLRGSKGSAPDAIGVMNGVTIARRFSKRTESRISSAAESEFQCDRFSVAHDLGKDGGGVDKILENPDIMEVVGEGVCSLEQVRGLDGERLGRVSGVVNGGVGEESVKGGLVEVSEGKVLDCLPQGDETGEGMTLYLTVPLLESGGCLAAAVMSNEKQGGLGEELSVISNEITLDLVEVDNALDLCEAQPLQRMDFLKAGKAEEARWGMTEFGNGADGANWADFGEINVHEKSAGGVFLNEEFPPLCKENLELRKNKVVQPAEEQQGKVE